VTDRYASVFISHGAPTLPLDEHPAREFLISLGGLKQPAAIVALSPHWLTRSLEVKSPERFETWHDFSGFPDALYDLQYRPRGDAALRQRVLDRLRDAGLGPQHAAGDVRLDHGVWIPLLLMYPGADVPVVQVSATSDSPRHYYELGRALRPLAQDGVLIVGSGGSVHNLGVLDWSGRGRPADWAVAFDDWVRERVLAGNWDELCDYRQLAPQPGRAHPTEDHFLPLFFAGGAGGAATSLHRSFSYGNIGMAAYGFL